MRVSTGPTDTTVLGLDDFGQDQTVLKLSPQEAEKMLQAAAGEASRRKEALGPAVRDYLVAQAITILYGVGSELITNKSKSAAVWRIALLGLAGTLGYTTYRAFDLAMKSGAADSTVGTVAGGVAGTVQGFIGLGALFATFGKIDPSQAGKQYTLVTKVKQMSRFVRTKVAV